MCRGHDFNSLLVTELQGLLERALTEMRKSERTNKAVKAGESERIHAQMEMLKRLAENAQEKKLPANVEE